MRAIARYTQGPLATTACCIYLEKKVFANFTLRMKHIHTCKLFSQVVAVAARKLEDAQVFAQKHNILRAYGSYEELARDPDIGEKRVVYMI